MPRARSPERDLAYQLWLESGKQRELKDIAAELGVSPSQVRNWKTLDDWDDRKSCATIQTNNCATKRKRGGQPGNKNSNGPPGNKNAEKYGFLSKYLPAETKEIFDAVAKADPLDLMWQQIQIQYAAIIRAQRIAYVKDQQDKSIDISMTVDADSGSTTAYEIQQAWDKQENFLKAQSRAMATLANLIRQYEQMLRDRGVNATEEQRLRLDKLRAETDRIRRSNLPEQDDGVEIINDAPRQENGQDLGHCDSEVPADI